jgi:anti-sigma regulatory factor (Ser/Thr protein kinase)
MSRPEAAPDDGGRGPRTGEDDGRRWGSLELAASPESVPEARGWARRLAEDWELGDLDWPLLQLVTELVTNCVLHARTPSVLRIEQETATGVVRCQVSDLSTIRPRRRAHSSGATTGRGLQMLERLSSSWGVTPSPTGKTVWFELHEGAGGQFLEEDWEALADLDGTPSPAGRPAPARTVARAVHRDAVRRFGVQGLDVQGRAA